MPEDVPLVLDFVPPLSLHRGPSFVLAVAVLGLALGALLIGLRVHARRLERARARERAQLSEQAPLREGLHAVLEGNIESRESGTPVVATVTERRSEVDPSGWTEIHREVTARAFDLETGTGTVRVEPGLNALVAATLDGETRTPTGRTRRAELERGSRVLAYGSLVRERHAFAVYRGGAEGWTLRAPRGGRVLLADAALVTRYDHRIQILHRFTNVALPLWLAFHAVCTSPFLVASFAGTQTSSTLLDWIDEEERGKALLAWRRRVRTQTTDGLIVESTVASPVEVELRTQNVTTVPLLRSAWPAACYVGGEAWIFAPPVLLALIAAPIALLILRRRYRHATPWYDRT